jgi:8-oxo-dGTP pyrophosphatase MutT (NUDIX family)
MAIKNSLPISVMRAAGTARSLYWRTMKPLTFGAALAVTDVNCERIALVRPTYGKKDQWQLPGGGIDRTDWDIARKRVESGQYPHTLPSKLFEPSARREGHEEIGVDTDGYPLVHKLNYVSDENGNRDTLGIFHFMLPDIEVVEFRPQRSEIAEVKLWEIDAMPVTGASYLCELAQTLRQNR